MIAIGGDLVETIQNALGVAFVVFLRVGAAMAVLPAFGETSVSVRIRLVLAIMFTAIVTPAATPLIGPGLGDVDVVAGVLATETVIGLALGLVFRFFVFVLQIAGTIAAQATSLAQLLGGSGMEPLPAIGHLLTVGGLALAVINNLHVSVAEVFIASYQVMPAGRMPDASTFSSWGVARIASTFALAFTLAAPFVIASFLYNFTLGVINRAMPQLMVAFVGAPAITAGGLILLFLSMPVLLAVWHDHLLRFVANPFAGAP